MSCSQESIDKRKIKLLISQAITPKCWVFLCLCYCMRSVALIRVRDKTLKRKYSDLILAPTNAVSVRERIIFLSCKHVFSL